MDVIVTKDLCKTYHVGFRRKKVEAVKGLSLKVQQGEVFGFIGPNGAGKTTAIKMLMGLNRPSSGTATIFGEDCRSVKHKGRIGFLPERPYFYQYLTAWEFMDFYGRLFGLSSELRKERARTLLERVDMLHKADVPLRKFSKGMLQRVGMAQALIGDPELIILDEPMSGLDPLGRMLIRDIILDLKAEGRTLLFCSHILSDVQMICDRVAFLKNGSLVSIGTLGDLTGGQAPQIEVTVLAAPESISEPIRALATRLVAHQGRTLMVVDNQDQQITLMNALLKAQVPIESVVPHQPSLEEVFLENLQGDKPERVKGGVAS